MKFEKIFKTLLAWLPSMMISVFFVLNACDKILYADQLDKIITNNVILAAVGFMLLISTALFLYDKTIIYGTAFLATYMTCVTFIHLYKGKPFEVVLLITICVVFAAYFRKPQIFYQNEKAFVIRP